MSKRSWRASCSSLWRRPLFADPISYIFIAVYGLAVVVILASRFNVVAPATFSYAVVVATALIRYSEFGLEAPDAIYYDQIALAIAQGETSSAISAGKEGLSQTLAVVYSVLGHDPVFGLWINAIACALMVAMVGGIAQRLDMPTKTAAWIAAVYPAFIVWGTLLLREAIVWLCLATLLFAVSGIVKHVGRVGWNVALLIMSFVALLAFRGSIGIAVLVASLAAIVLSRSRDRKREWLTYFIVALVLVVAYATPLSAQIEGIFERYTFERVEISREALQRTGETGFATGSGAPFMIAISVLPRVLAGPFIWEFSTVGTAGVIEGALWVLLLILAIRGWMRLTDRRSANVLVVPALVLIYVLAMTSGNYGTMIRLRTQVALMLIPLAAAGLSRVKKAAVERGGLKGPLSIHAEVRGSRRR